MKEKTTIMDELAQSRALFRISHEIIEKNKGTDGIVLLGILTRGLPMAKRIRDNIKKIEGVELPLGSLDITLYRDDLTEISDMPEAKQTKIDFSGLSWAAFVAYATAWALSRAGIIPSKRLSV